MADSGLPVSLQGLKIADGREPPEKASILRKTMNPFSSEGGACKKMRRVSSATSLNEVRSNGCRMSLFGKKCTKLKPPSTSCECISHYVPSKIDPSNRNVLQVKPTSFIRSNIIRKSTLNFLRFQHAKNLDLSSTPLGNSVTNISRSNTFDESPSSQTYHTDLKTDPSSISQPSDLFGRCVVNDQDFQSLISSSNDKTVPGGSTLDFDTPTFRSRIRSYPRRYSRRLPRSRSSDDVEENETLSTVAKKLAATEISTTTSASCSQQARLTANAYCDEHDISIDELASYFEDFVHIPKKMSLMAEQMYI